MQRILILLVALLLAACAGAPALPPTTPAATPGGVPGETPLPTFDPATSCTGSGIPDGAVRHPGWPPDETFELLPIPISTELAIGPTRFLVNLLDETNQSVAAAELPVELRFYDLASDPAQPALSAQASHMTVADHLPGLYRATVDFPCWGEWGVEALTSEPDGSQRSGRMVFNVRPMSTTPALGAAVPSVSTPTADTPEEIAAISTDDDPNPALYSVSVDEALAAHRPFLLIFATPAFCRTATCGPALDIVKQASASRANDEVAFIHVEPYELEQVADGLQLKLNEDNLPIVVPSVDAWGLPTEPYIFIVDEQGRLVAKLEGVAAADEIEAALAEVTD